MTLNDSKICRLSLSLLFIKDQEDLGKHFEEYFLLSKLISCSLDCQVQKDLDFVAFFTTGTLGTEYRSILKHVRTQIRFYVCTEVDSRACNNSLEVIVLPSFRMCIPLPCYLFIYLFEPCL